jgi:hypothetical protein
MRKALEKRLLSLKWRFRPDMAGKVAAPPALDAAAKLLGLNHKDPSQRDLLLLLLAEAIFGKGQAGRPKGRHGYSGGWGIRKLDRLALLYEGYCKNGFRGDSEIARQVHADHKKEFGSSAEAIRRWLPYARWTREELLEKHRLDDVPDLPEGWDEPDYDDD